MCWLKRPAIEIELKEAEPSAAQESTVRADYAWRILSLTNEWVRHADAKTGVTLAFVGATAALLFNLVEDGQTWTNPLIGAVVLAAVAIVSSVVCSAASLFARTKRGEPRAGGRADVADDDTVNLLFFGDVHKHYAEDRPTYRQVLSLLTADRDRLVGQIADQIHANARIATVKFKWTNRAILAELIAATATAATALFIATGS